jgi:hypothetical protein
VNAKALNEGIASHIDPESCGATREGGVEALTGENMGRVFSRVELTRGRRRCKEKRKAPPSTPITRGVRRSWSTCAPETAGASPLTRRMPTRARAQIPRRPPRIPSCWGNLPWPTWTNKSRQKILNQELQVISSVVQLSPQWQGGRRSPWLPARNSNAQCDERPFLPRSRIATLP